MSSSVCMVYVPFPNADIARFVAEQLLKLQLIGCANIFPAGTSLYLWEHKVVESSEVIAIFKTTTAHAAAAEAEILRHHPYSTPCVLIISATSNPIFKKWLENCTKIVASADNMR